MGVINANVSGAALPYSVVVRMVGEETGNRCTGSCNSMPVTFTHDSGDNTYYFIITDANGCVKDSRNVNGGISNINCDIIQPNFDAAFTNPVCISGNTYTDAIITLTNITNAARYKVCYNTVEMNCAPCTDSDGLITGTSQTINLPIEPGSMGSRGILLRVYKDSTCDAYKEYFATAVLTPCSGGEQPDFSAAVLQPYCSSQTGGSVVNATLQLTNITNATRYKICYNSTYNCSSDCSVSDGTITGTSQDIDITAPAAGVTQNVTIRVYNGSGCSVFKDYSFSIYSPKCGSDEVNMLIVDLNTATSTGGNCVPVTSGGRDYDAYFTPNTVGMSENGLRAEVKGTSTRNLPNGNDVPNVMISAAIKLACGPGPFYRWAFNLSYIRAKYPNLNVVTFDMYARTIKTGNNANMNVIGQAFKGVRMVKFLHPEALNGSPGCSSGTITCGNPVGSQDAYRDPRYNGVVPAPTLGGYFNSSLIPSTYVKIGSLSYNFTTNAISWVAAL